MFDIEEGIAALQEAHQEDSLNQLQQEFERAAYAYGVAPAICTLLAELVRQRTEGLIYEAASH